ncbi:MAG: hypothetical protein HY741_14220 [Chloroflexi bacterium]|nr:hypothetical protein [Chloroflexota bacterium]
MHQLELHSRLFKTSGVHAILGGFEPRHTDSMIPKASVVRLREGLGILLLFVLLAGCQLAASNQDSIRSSSVATAPTLGRGQSDAVETAAPETNPCFDSGCHAELKREEQPFKHSP